MYSPVEENYLKALYKLADERGEVNFKELSMHLQIKMPTVNSMIKKFAEKGLVFYKKYKPIRLTALGERCAALIVRKHRLTEMFLVKVMGFGWDEVHEIAEELEHVSAQAFFEKMDELLNYPLVDPHGEPIPDREGKVWRHNYRRLNECNLYTPLVFKSVTDCSDRFLKFLTQKELCLGKTIRIIALEPFDLTYTLCYDPNKTEVFSKAICSKILVETI